MEILKKIEEFLNQNMCILRVVEMKVRMRVCMLA